MRITNNMLASWVSRGLSQNQQQFAKTQEIIATGLRVNRPSDDPAAMGRALDLRSQVAALEQYSRNIDFAENRILTAETALEAASDLLAEVKSIVADQMSGNTTTASRELAESQVQALYDQVMDLANTRSGTVYLFAGNQTGSPPFSRDENDNPIFQGDWGDRTVQVAENMTVSVNAGGDNAFVENAVDGVDVFATLKTVIDSIESGDTEALAAGQEQLSACVARVDAVRAESAAAYNRLESSENLLSKLKLNLENTLTETEGADMVQTVLELQILESAYQTALQAAARIIQPSLMSFLS